METKRSLYRRSAEDGLLAGPILAAAVILAGAVSYVPWLSLPALIAIAAVPTIMYITLRRGFREDGYRSTFSALWLQGICTFFFGSLLMGVAVYVSLRWIWPEFITDQMNILMQILNDSGDADAGQVAEAIDRMLQNGTLPTPIDIALELMYLAVFTGSLLSMLLAAIIRAGRPRTTPPPFTN